MEEFDDCYCPHGVQQRTSFRIHAIMFGVSAAVMYITLLGLKELANWVLVMFEQAGRQVLHNTDKIGFTVLAVCCGILLFLFVADRIADERASLTPKWMRYIKKKVTAYFYKKDLQKRFQERPELSELKFDDIMADMNDGHHSDRPPMTKEELAIYLQQFYLLQDEQRTTTGDDAI